jgi:hypothetical protein
MMSSVSLEAHEICAPNRCRPVERVSRWPLRNYVSVTLASYSTCTMSRVCKHNAVSFP